MSPTPIRLPLSPRQAEALSTLLEFFPVGRRVEQTWSPDAVAALREVAEKLDALKEAR